MNDISSSVTSNSNTGKNFVGDSQGIPTVFIPAGVLRGEIKDSSSGVPILDASVTASYDGHSLVAFTNSNTVYNYQMAFAGSEDYSLSASAPQYNTVEGSISIVMDTINSWSASLTYYYIPPGCVLNGAEISLAGGGDTQVQNLSVGSQIMSYNITSGSFVRGTVVGITVSNVTQVWEIDGIVGVSGRHDQPLYVQLQNGTDEWLVLGKLNTTMKVFDPLNATWLPIVNISILNGTFAVYDISAAPAFPNGTTHGGDYIANGLLFDDKQA